MNTFERSPQLQFGVACALCGLNDVFVVHHGVVHGLAKEAVAALAQIGGYDSAENARGNDVLVAAWPRAETLTAIHLTKVRNESAFAPDAGFAGDRELHGFYMADCERAESGN
jgi:hypothetical protein